MRDGRKSTGLPKHPPSRIACAIRAIRAADFPYQLKPVPAETLESSPEKPADKDTLIREFTKR